MRAVVALILGGGPALAGFTTLDPFGSTYVQAWRVSGKNAVGTSIDRSTNFQFGYMYNGLPRLAI